MGQSAKETSRPTAVMMLQDTFTKDLTMMALHAEGYAVTSTSSPSELAFETGMGRPALVVLDEPSLAMLEGRPESPTIVLLSMASPLTIDDVREIAAVNAAAGVATDYLPAPWSPLELTRAARRVRRMSRMKPQISDGITVHLDLAGLSA